MRRLLIAGGAAAAALATQATTALACGGLVAPDGDVQLNRATTFVAYHAGVEHYVTSFAYQGSAPDVGWIVPLPSVPDSIQPAGRWTLQRLEREFQPPIEFDAIGFAAPQAAAADSIVVEQVQVEALDVTILKGSGQAVIDWCTHNGFLLPAETRAHLLMYAQGSPVFMAAKYDTAAAQQRGQVTGDGVPLLITMRTPRLWVPLEVLASHGLTVRADLFLLTDDPIRTIAQASLRDASSVGVDGAPGFVVVKQEAMGALLHQNLASDRNMGWMPDQGYVTFLTLNAPGDQVTYDLGVGSDSVIRLASFGTPSTHFAGAALYTPSLPDSTAQLLAALLILASFVVVTPLVVIAWRRA